MVRGSRLSPLAADPRGPGAGVSGELGGRAELRDQEPGTPARLLPTIRLTPGQVAPGRIQLYTAKTGQPVWVPIPPAVDEALQCLRRSDYFFQSYGAVAQDHAISLATLVRWVQRARTTGSVDPLARGGGWRSPVDLTVLHRLVQERPDRTTDELTCTYNREAVTTARVHRSSILRALQRTGYVFKEKADGRRNKIGRVHEERERFREWIAQVDPRRLVFLDESGVNLAMGRSHAWLPRGTELIEPRPMNWGGNLSMVGAMRIDGWLTLGTYWGSITTTRFTAWVARRFVPQLRPEDIVVLDKPRGPQSPARPRADRGGRGRRPVPAAVLAGLQPHRVGLGPDQETDSRRRTPDVAAAAPHRPARTAGGEATALHKSWCAHAGYRYQLK